MTLTEKLNVSRQAVSRWENGQAIPSIDNIKYLSNLYGVSVDYLLHTGAENPVKNECPLQEINVDSGGKNNHTNRTKIAVLIAVALLWRHLLT